MKVRVPEVSITRGKLEDKNDVHRFDPMTDEDWERFVDFYQYLEAKKNPGSALWCCSNCSYCEGILDKVLMHA